MALRLLLTSLRIIRKKDGNLLAVFGIAFCSRFRQLPSCLHLSGLARKDGATPLSIRCIARSRLNKRFGDSQQCLRGKLVPRHPCDAVRKLHAKTLIRSTGNTCVSRAAAVLDRTREMRTIKV